MSQSGGDVTRRRFIHATVAAAGAAALPFDSLVAQTMFDGVLNPQSDAFAPYTLQRPGDSPHSREFDVIVGSPPDVTRVDADSVYYAGTLAFFGFMKHEGEMAHDTTFTVPLPQRREIFPNAEAAEASLNIRIVPAQRHGNARH